MIARAQLPCLDPGCDCEVVPAETLTFDDIMDAVTTGSAEYIDGWNALSEPGSPGRVEARRRIREAIARQSGGVS